MTSLGRLCFYSIVHILDGNLRISRLSAQGAPFTGSGSFLSAGDGLRWEAVEGAKDIAQLCQKERGRAEGGDTYLLKFKCLNDNSYSYAFHSDGFSSRKLSGGDLKDGVYHLEVYSLVEKNAATESQNLELQAEAWEKSVAAILRQTIVDDAQGEYLRCASGFGGRLLVGAFSSISENALIETLVDTLMLSHEAAESYVADFIGEFSKKPANCDDTLEERITDTFFHEIIAKTEARVRESTARVERFSSEQIKKLGEKVASLEFDLRDKKIQLEQTEMQAQETIARIEREHDEKVREMHENLANLEHSVQEKQFEMERADAYAKELVARIKRESGEQISSLNDNIVVLEHKLQNKQHEFDRIDTRIKSSIEKLKRDSAEQIRLLEEMFAATESVEWGDTSEEDQIDPDLATMYPLPIKRKR